MGGGGSQGERGCDSTRRAVRRGWGLDTDILGMSEGGCVVTLSGDLRPGAPRGKYSHNLLLLHRNTQHHCCFHGFVIKFEYSIRVLHENENFMFVHQCLMFNRRNNHRVSGRNSAIRLQVSLLACVCSKTCLATVLIRSIFAREKLHERFSASAVFPAQNRTN